MTYSCTDFTDDILNALEINVPDAFCDSPSDQADLALAEIERLQAGQRGLVFDNEEAAIILAGLRMIQRSGVASPEEDIATGGGEFDAMGDDAIDLLCERINSDVALAPSAYPIAGLGAHWLSAAEVHRDAMRAAGTTAENTIDEQKARAAEAVAEALAAYAKLTDGPLPAALTDWRTIAGNLHGALSGAVEQIEQMKGMFDDDDVAIQRALDDADEAMALYCAAPATAPTMPAAVTVWTCVTDGDNCPLTVSVHVSQDAAEERARADLREDCRPSQLSHLNTLSGHDLSEAWESANDGACIIESHEIALTPAAV